MNQPQVGPQQQQAQLPPCGSSISTSSLHPMSGLDSTLDKIMGIIKAPELTAEQQRTIMMDSIHNW